MVKRLLPSFDSASITREQIRIDKFCIEFKKHRVQSYLPNSAASDDNFSEYLNFIHTSSDLFRIQTKKNSSYPALAFKGNFHISGKPISFYLSKANPFQPRTALHSKTQMRNFDLLLNCNFTRFYNAQQDRALPLGKERGDAAWWHHAGVWEQRPRLPLPAHYHGQTLAALDLLRDGEDNQTRRRRRTEERVLGNRPSTTTPRTLDGNDNMLSEGIWRKTSNVLQLFSFYLALCMDEVERGFTMADPELQGNIAPINQRRTPDGHINDEAFLANHTVVPLFDWDGGNMSELQLYTEIGVGNALEWMRLYSPAIHQAARDYVQADYPVSIHGRELESPSITVWLTKIISMKIYAKYTNRIRFEITYKNVRSAINFRMKKFQVAGISPKLKLADGESSLIDMVSVAMDDTVERIRTFIDDLPVPRQPSYDIQALNRLMWAINSVVKDDNTADYSTAERILSCLITNRAIAQYDDNKSMLLKLKRRKYLVKIQSTERPSPPRYRLAPEYEAALRAFASHYPDDDATEE